MEQLPPATSNQLLTIVQLFGEAVKPVRDDVRDISRKLDILRADIERTYYDKDVIDAMERTNQEKIHNLDSQIAELARVIKTIQEALAGQWEKWLLRAGMVASLLLNVFALIKILG
jgi:peptidoglycan hydrolase CwlO-like protein